MKIAKYIIASIALIICQFLPCSGQTIKVGTFNSEFLIKSKVHIKFGVPFDLDDASPQQKAFWSNQSNRNDKFIEATKEVALFIKSLNVDILTLTEVGDSNDLDLLSDELIDIGVNFPHRKMCQCTDGGTGQKVAVFSKYPLKDLQAKIPGRAIYLTESDGDEEKDTGISKGMKVTATVNGKDIDIFVLHLISERGGYDSDQQRKAQATVARRQIVKSLNQGNRVIVAGDLNSEKGHETLYRLRGFDDIYEDLIQTGNSNYFKSQNIRWTYSFRGEPEQIDHILISNNLSSKSNIETSIIKPPSDFVSDHNALIVQVKLRN